MFEVIGLLIGVLSFLYAIWQHVEARQAARRAEEAEATLRVALDDLPRQLAEAMTLVAQKAPPSEHASGPGTQANRQTRDWSLTGSWNSLDHADVDNDGREELLVQYPGGVHGSVLQVFGLKDGVFTELASLGTGTPTGFRWADFDGDGQVEIEGEETDWSSDEPYVSAPRLRVRWRWNGQTFVEVSREPVAR
jgi:hypothetical protein